jgi:hypothetical protein
LQVSRRSAERWWPITKVDFTPDDGAGVPTGLGVDISASSSGPAALDAVS